MIEIKIIDYLLRVEVLSLVEPKSACPGLKGGASPSLVEEYKIVYIGKILKNVSQFRSKLYPK